MRVRLVSILFISFLPSLFCQSVYGQKDVAIQTAQADSVRGFIEGRLLDTDGQPMQGATLRVLSVRDSTLKGGAVTDTLGRYHIDGLQTGGYIMQYSMLGYKAGAISFNILAGRSRVAAPDVMMQPSDRTIGEALVVGALPPVTVIEDTVAYNADAYKVAEGAMVEDLVEQIPGAEVTDDGKIKINGKEYTKILVNGKEFFGDDLQAALKNLPAKLVKRIKTYDRKSDAARLSGIDDGEEQNVIDLEMKPDAFKGLVGQANGAAGNHDRYSSSLNVNRFRKNSHLSLMAGMNNVNNPAFSEKGEGAMNYSRASRPGLTTAKSIGLTVANEKKNKYKINGNVRYGYTNTDGHTWRDAETVYNDSNYRYTAGENHSVRRRHELNSNFFMEWKPDTLTALQMRPSFNYSSTDNDGTGHTDVHSWNGRADTVAINDQNTKSKNGADATSGSVSVNAFRRLSRKGRNVSARASLGYNDSKSESFTRNKLIYFLQKRRNRNYNRYNDGDSHRFNYSLGLSYNEPLFKHAFLQFRYDYSYTHSRSNRYGRQKNYSASDSLFDAEAPIAWDEIKIDTALSSCTENTYRSHTFNLNMRHVYQKLNLSYGVKLNPRHNEVNYVFGPKMDKGLITQNLLNWSPNLHLKYRFTKRTNFDAQYNGQSSEPNVDNLQEVIDKTNPQYVRYGNPSLKPSFTNSLRVNFNHYGEKTHRSLVTNLTYNNTSNNTSTMILSESATGMRVSKLMNMNGNWNASAGINFNMPIDSLEHFNLSTASSMNYSENTNYNSTPLTTDNLREAGVVHDFSNLDPDDIDRLQPYALMNHTQTLRLRQNLTLTYRLKKFMVRMAGGVAYYKLDNSIRKANSRETFDYNANLTLQTELPLNSQLTSRFAFTSRHGYTAGIKKNIAVWNIQMSKRCLKHNAGLFTLQIYDLLHQRTDITRSISNLTITDTRSQMLRSYFILGFQYRINTMGNTAKRSGGVKKGNRGKAPASNATKKTSTKR